MGTEQGQELVNRFVYHAPPDEATKAAHEGVRADCGATAMMWMRVLPEGREKALAFTKLEEAMFWANAAIARHSPVADAIASTIAHGG